MGRELANFCRERAKECREAAERAPTERLRSYWREAEAQWLKRHAALAPSDAEPKSEWILPEEPASPSIPPHIEGRLPFGITADRMKEWLDRLREGIQRRQHGRGPPEDPEIYRERAQGCRKAADSAQDEKLRAYWLAAEAYWLSLANKERGQ
jgi:hypothetical protein